MKNALPILLVVTSLSSAQFSNFGTPGSNIALQQQMQMNTIAADPNLSRDYQATKLDNSTEIFSARIDTDNPNRWIDKSLFGTDKIWNFSDYKQVDVKIDGEWKPVYLIMQKLCYPNVTGAITLFSTLDGNNQKENYFAISYKNDTLPYSESLLRSYLAQSADGQKYADQASSAHTTRNIFLYGGLGLAALGFMTSFETKDDGLGNKKSDFNPNPLLFLGAASTLVAGFIDDEPKKDLLEGVKAFNAENPAIGNTNTNSFIPPVQFSVDSIH